MNNGESLYDSSFLFGSVSSMYIDSTTSNNHLIIGNSLEN